MAPTDPVRDPVVTRRRDLAGPDGRSGRSRAPDRTTTTTTATSTGGSGADSKGVATPKLTAVVSLSRHRVLATYDRDLDAAA